MQSDLTSARSEWVEVGGINVHYLTAGEGPRTALLLHGGGIDEGRFTWRSAIGPLSETHRVIVPDLPGYGESDKPHIDYTMDFYGDFVRDFMAELGLAEADLVGLSLGGGVALNVALRHPSLVRRLVPVGSYGLTHKINNPWLTWLFTRIPPAHRYLYKQSGRSREKIRAHFVRAAPGLTDEMVEEMYELYQRPDAGRAFRNTNRNDVTPRGLKADYSGQVEAIRVPTMFVHGEADPAVPLFRGEQAASRMENARVRAVEGAGHFAPRERPEEFNALLIDFLSEG